MKKKKQKKQSKKEEPFFDERMINFFIIIIGLYLVYLFWLYNTIDTKGLENRELFCKSQEMSLSNDEKYCFDGIEKMYWIELVGYEYKWYDFRGYGIEKDFKLVKEVVSLGDKKNEEKTKEGN